MTETQTGPPSSHRPVAGSLLCLVLALVPFWTVTSTWFVIAQPVIIALIGLGVLQSLWNNRVTSHLSPLLIALVGWVLIGVWRSPELDRGVELATCWLIGGGLAWLGQRSATTNPVLPRNLLVTLWVTATFVALTNIAVPASYEDLAALIAEQADRLPETQRLAILHAAAQPRLSYPFGNPNHLGVFLGLALLGGCPLWLTWWRGERRPVFGLGLLVTTVLMLLALWGTRSRTAVVALAVAGVLMLTQGLGRNRKVVLSVLFASGLVGSALLAATAVGRDMLSRIETIEARLLYWQTALRAISAAPLTGHGVGGYGKVFTQHRPLSPHQTLYPHNLILEAGTDLGAIGLVLVLAAVLMAGRVLWRQRNQLPGWFGPMLVLGGLATQVDFTFDLPTTLWPLALLLGAGWPCCRERQDSGSVDRPQAVPRLLGSLLVVLVCLATSLQTWAHARYDRITEHGGQRHPRTVLRELKQVTAVWPPLTKAYGYQGYLWAQLGEKAKSEQALREAIRRDPLAANRYESLAILLWNDPSRRDEAVTLQKKAVALHPLKWNYHDRLARWLFEQGDRTGADHHRQLADEYKVFEPDYAAALEATQAALEGNK